MRHATAYLAVDEQASSIAWHFLRWYLSAPDGFVDALDLAWVEAAGDILHAHSGADEVQHGLPLQEGCCRDVHVEGEA